MSAAKLHVWDASVEADRSEWLSAWQGWQGREVFAHPDFVRLWCSDTRSRPMATFLQTKDASVLHAFVLRDLAGERFWSSDDGACADITSPYGYAGPFVWDASDRDSVAAAFWSAYMAWARDAGVVSEFVRRLPVSDACLPAPTGMEYTTGENVIRDLTVSLDSIWHEYEHKVRKNVNKARRSGVTVEEDSTGACLDQFLSLYRGTMDRRAAAQRYYFDRDFFEALHRAIPGGYRYIYAMHGGRAVSAELVLLSAHRSYSFLGGTDADAFDLRPNDLVKHHIIETSKQLGLHQFVLGGGYERDDGIFRYKRGFAPHGVVPYTTLRIVHDRESYDRLTRRAAGDAASEFFPAYRATQSATP